MLATESDANDNRTCWEKAAPAAHTVVCVCFRLLQCNNPKTKEPKLTAAARIVPEWVEYDNEIKQLLGRLQPQEDTATPTHTASPSQHDKGYQRNAF